MKSFIEVSGRASNKLKDLAEKVALECIKCMSQPDKLEVAIKFVSEKEILSAGNSIGLEVLGEISEEGGR